jgi:hypothetical protein
MELYRCLDCDFVGNLEKGGCSKCCSQATISEEIVRIHDIEYEVINTEREREEECASVLVATPLPVAVRKKSQLTLLLIMISSATRTKFSSMSSKGVKSR